MIQILLKLNLKENRKKLRIGLVIKKASRTPFSGFIAIKITRYKRDSVFAAFCMCYSPNEEIQNLPVTILLYLRRKLDKKIRKLQTKELTLDDLDDEESIYIREDQYKRKFNQIWNLLCQYKKRSTLIGRKIEKRFHFEGSRYQSIDEAVERLGKEKNEAEFLGLTSRDEEDLAADIFKEIGKELQRRRQLDVEEDLASYIPDNIEIEDDPADHDEELKSKLTKSAIDGEKT
ncbi:death domain-associated protein 6 [Caerostris extrusa]|uniref:Death domain-associated protein 6 n=1 Tax=Caerostris extrusa TaxID=172846 RepID=A0AAV4XCZ6_CAEEX|nr:death domain-associated protein 6 [Caerostris extrusa]